MYGAWAALTLCAAALAANAVTHLLFYRSTRRYMRAIFVGFVAGLTVLLVGEAVIIIGDRRNVLEAVIRLVADGLLYGCTSFLFFNFINAGESAIRIRILRELRAAGRSLPEAELLEAYNDGSIVEARLARMLANGQLEMVNGHYRLRSQTLVRMAYFFLTLKWVLLRRSSEFEHGRLPPSTI